MASVRALLIAYSSVSQWEERNTKIFLLVTLKTTPKTLHAYIIAFLYFTRYKNKILYYFISKNASTC